MAGCYDDVVDESAAKARHDWPIRRFRLGEEPGDDQSAASGPEERLAMMWPLAREAWHLSGREVPDYPREATPGRVVRSGRR